MKIYGFMMHRMFETLMSKTTSLLSKLYHLHLNSFSITFDFKNRGNMWVASPFCCFSFIFLNNIRIVLFLWVGLACFDLHEYNYWLITLHQGTGDDDFGLAYMLRQCTGYAI